MVAIDMTIIAKNNEEYLRRKRGGFDMPKKRPEEEKSEFYKRGEQMAREVMDEIFEKLEHGEHRTSPWSRLSGG